MNYLDDKAMTILVDIFRQTRGKSLGVDALSYRANHEDQLDLIDKLERDGFLRKENERYWISLVAFSSLEDDEARRFIVKFDTIFDVIRQFYKSHPHDQLKLSDISQMVKMPIDDVRECLSYMVEGSWWGSRGDFYASDESSLKPSESILRYKSFNDVIKQLQEWAKQRIADRINFEKKPRENRASSTLPRGKPGMFRETAVRQKPDWYDKLDSEYQALLDEVYLALANEMRALPAMGLRTVIDMTCLKLIGDIGTFDKKIGSVEKRRPV